MGQVIIIKNNSKENKIYQFARESYEKKKRCLYNAQDGTENEKQVIKIKEKYEGNGIILFLTYKLNEENKEIISDAYIGTGVEINEKNNISYLMKIYLENGKHSRAIASIVDKIDLDIKKDFEKGSFVIMSDMDSLYRELRERLIVVEGIMTSTKQEIVRNDLPEIYQLDPLAQKDQQANRLYISSNAGKYRTDFQRDRERVVNCKAFRRMVDKAQIFSAEKGDYYRTRMTHSLEVNQIAKAIAYALNLNMDLTEAIALGHDLGHTPFGHQGERTLDNILSGKEVVGIEAKGELFKERCFGGFKHNYQSARILAHLEEKYIDYPGLNVSAQVIEGVLKHTKLKPREIKLEDFLEEEYIEKIVIDECEELQVCSSLEGQVVAVADEIAQRGHDVDDALTSGVMTIDEFIDRLKISKCSRLETKIKEEKAAIEKTARLIPDKKELLIARIVSCIVDYFVTEAIGYSRENMIANREMREITLNNTKRIIGFHPDVEEVNSYLERVVRKKVICNNEVARADYNANVIVKQLFQKYYFNPRLLHEGTMHKIFIEMLLHKNKQVSNSAVNLCDSGTEIVDAEIEEMTCAPIDTDIVLRYRNGEVELAEDMNIIIFEKRKILIRSIVDYIAGMTDGYALEEYEKLK